MHPLAGNDYGLGKTNIDTETGIRFGVIHQHNVNLEWESDTETHYTPRCPNCGNDAVDIDGISDDTESWEMDEHDCPDFGCDSCKYLFGVNLAYGDEPDATTLTGEYEGHVDSYGDIWILDSPYYTHAAFCSPCAPGACSLSVPVPEGPRAYCLGSEMFSEDHPMPYPLFSVKTGRQVNVH